MLDFSSDITAVSLFEECVELSNCGAELSFIGETALGVPIPCVSLGEGKRCSLFVGAHHGMERITANILLKFARELLCGVPSEAPRILSSRRVIVVPMLNVDGCAISLGKFKRDDPLFLPLEKMCGGADLSRWQANARGVDLNHNYDAGFEKCKESERALGIISPSPTRYGGKFPESEPETKAFCALTRRLAPRLNVAVALHTQGEEIYFDHEKNAPKGALELAEKFAAASGYTVSRPEAAASHGGCKDWVIEEFGIPAFTVECGKGANPLPAGDFDKIYEKVRPILILAASF